MKYQMYWQKFHYNRSNGVTEQVGVTLVTARYGVAVAVLVPGAVAPVAIAADGRGAALLVASLWKFREQCSDRGDRWTLLP